MQHDRIRRLAVLTLLAALPAHAQTPPAPPEGTAEKTRAEEWSEQRNERRDHLTPYRPGWLERTLLGLEKADRPPLDQWNRWGLYPRIQGIAADSRLAAGLRLWRPDIGSTKVSFHASAFYSQNEYQFYDVQVGRIPHGRGLPPRSMRGEEVYELSSLPRQLFQGHLILYASLRYQDYTRLNYFGLGSDTSLDDRTTYRLSGSRYEMVTGWQFTPRLAVTLRGGYWTPDVRSGTNPDFPSVEEVFTEADTPGLTTQPDFLMTTAQVFFDTRDKPGAPKRGAMIALQASRFDPRGSDEFRFRRYSGDLRGFLPLGSPQRVLALRTYFAIDNADSSKGRNVPFYLQDSLGGSRTLRGYESFRFRGTDTLLFQAEYRWEPWPPLELALFGDAGRVAAEGDDLSLSGLRGDYGVGLRVKSARGVILRFDVAFGGEANRFYVRFGSGW